MAKQDIFLKSLTCKTLSLQSIKQIICYHVLSQYFISVVFRMLKSTRTCKTVAVACERARVITHVLMCTGTLVSVRGLQAETGLTLLMQHCIYSS